MMQVLERQGRFFFRARDEKGIAWHIDASGVVWTLIDNGKLANQIARLVAIVAKSLLAKRPTHLSREVTRLQLFLAQVWEACRDLHEEYSGAITLSTELSRPFSCFAPKICIVMSVVPWSRHYRKFWLTCWLSDLMGMASTPAYWTNKKCRSSV